MGRPAKTTHRIVRSDFSLDAMAPPTTLKILSRHARRRNLRLRIASAKRLRFLFHDFTRTFEGRISAGVLHNPQAEELSR